MSLLPGVGMGAWIGGQAQVCVHRSPAVHDSFDTSGSLWHSGAYSSHTAMRMPLSLGGSGLQCTSHPA